MIHQALREEKKFHDGAQFFQTDQIYDVEGFERYLAALDRRGVLGRVYILAGIAPIRSPKAARLMSEVPGVKVPAAVITRLEQAKDPKEEGEQIAWEIVSRVRRLPGVSGIHFMAISWESIVPRLVMEAGLRPVASAAVQVGRPRHPSMHVILIGDVHANWDTLLHCSRLSRGPTPCSWSGTPWITGQTHRNPALAIGQREGGSAGNRDAAVLPTTKRAPIAATTAGTAPRSGCACYGSVPIQSIN